MELNTIFGSTNRENLQTVLSKDPMESSRDKIT